MLDTRAFDARRFLRHQPLFADLTEASLERLSHGCTLERVERGDAVLRMGDPCDAFRVVVTGQVKLFVISPTGQEKVIEIIGPAGSFGEALMFLCKPCLVNVQALTDALLIAVGRDALLEEMSTDPQVSMRMLAGLSRRLHSLVHDVQAYALQSGMQRVIGYLLRDQTAEDCVSGEWITVSLPVSKATIASRLSLTPEYFSRVLRDLEEAGLIEVDKRDIHIRDPRRLATWGS